MAGGHMSWLMLVPNLNCFEIIRLLTVGKELNGLSDTNEKLLWAYCLCYINLSMCWCGKVRRRKRIISVCRRGCRGSKGGAIIYFNS